MLLQIVPLVMFYRRSAFVLCVHCFFFNSFSALVSDHLSCSYELPLGIDIKGRLMK